jgi:hypothetical protein
VKVLLLSIASWIGLDFAAKDPEPFYGEIAPGPGPSILELAAAIKPPRDSGDTLAASLQVIRLLAAPEGSS